MTENLILYGFDGNNVQNLLDLEELSSHLSDVSLVLMENAINGLIYSDSSSKMETYESIQKYFQQIYYVEEDVLARGYNTELIPKTFHAISYSDLIDLIATANRIISKL